MKLVPTDVISKEELLEIQRLVEEQNRRHNQLMMLKDLMIKFATEYPDVVKEFCEK